MDRTIARVNQDIVTESDLGRIVADRTGSLNSHSSVSIDKATTSDVGALFDRTLLLQAAKIRKIDPPESEMQQHVESMIADIRSHFPTEAEFRKGLAAEQLTLEELKSQLLKRAETDYRVYQLVTSRFSVTESDSRDYESECAARGESPLSLHLRRLAVPVPETKGGAEKARQQVRELAARIFQEGLSFEDGVRKYSRVPGAKEDGGDLGYLSPQKLAPQVCEAVRELELGQASVPVVTGGFASIFYVEGRHGARSLLLEKKFTENREALLKELRRKANLQIYDSRLFRLLPDEYKRSGAVVSRGTYGVQGSASPGQPDAPPQSSAAQRPSSPAPAR